MGLKASLTIDPARLVFIDETWTKTNMARLGAEGAAIAGPRPVRALEHDDFRGRAPP
jgi:hypothetical protein